MVDSYKIRASYVKPFLTSVHTHCIFQLAILWKRLSRWNKKVYLIKSVEETLLYCSKWENNHCESQYGRKCIGYLPLIKANYPKLVCSGGALPWIPRIDNSLYHMRENIVSHKQILQTSAVLSAFLVCVILYRRSSWA